MPANQLLKTYYPGGRAMGAIGNRLLKPKRKPSHEGEARRLPRSRMYDEGYVMVPPDDGGSDMEMEVYKPQREKIQKRKKEKGRI